MTVQFWELLIVKLVNSDSIEFRAKYGFNLNWLNLISQHMYI